jgi:transcriptional regulator with XRE-family HTH domain
MFGEFIKNRRIARDISLRKFCQIIDCDASNWSKVEREILPPPQEEEKLNRIAEVLEIKKHTDEWQEMIDLARVSANKLPDDISSDRTIVDALPLFFRTVRSEKPSAEDLTKLLALLKKEA